MEDIKFSIIIPTYNEQDDIANTLDSLVALTYKNKEILVVDDSTDNTPNIIQAYDDRGVRLIRPEVRKGRCEARNIGVHNAIGEVLVILNADVLLPIDFLQQIKKHYDNGADIVCVGSAVLNQDDLFARYVGCTHDYEVSDEAYVQSQLWTEGYSVRRDVALKTKLFPSHFSVPIEAGEDAYFGEELERIGAKKIVDMSILVKHIAPASFQEYWSIRKGRGAGTPQIRRFLHKWSYQKIFLVATLKLIKRLIMLLTIVPMLVHNATIAKFSKKNKLLDTLLFSYAWFIEQLAMTIGEYKSLNKIKKQEQK